MILPLYFVTEEELASSIRFYAAVPDLPDWVLAERVCRSLNWDVTDAALVAMLRDRIREEKMKFENKNDTI